MWTFGKNINGELGIGDNKNKNIPTQVELLKEEEVNQISVGSGHTILLTNEGEVYSFGLNKNGQLGTGNNTSSNTPKKIDIPGSKELVPWVKENVVKVIANNNSSFVITQSGKVYGIGEGYGNSLVEIKKDYNIIDMTKNYALTDEGIVRRLNDDTEIKLSLNEYEKGSEPVYENDSIISIKEGKDHLLMLGKSRKSIQLWYKYIWAIR